MFDETGSGKGSGKSGGGISRPRAESYSGPASGPASGFVVSDSTGKISGGSRVLPSNPKKREFVAGSFPKITQKSSSLPRGFSLEGSRLKLPQVDNRDFAVSSGSFTASATSTSSPMKPGRNPEAIFNESPVPMRPSRLRTDANRFRPFSLDVSTLSNNASDHGPDSFRGSVKHKARVKVAKADLVASADVGDDARAAFAAIQDVARRHGGQVDQEWLVADQNEKGLFSQDALVVAGNMKKLTELKVSEPLWPLDIRRLFRAMNLIRQNDTAQRENLGLRHQLSKLQKSYSGLQTSFLEEKDRSKQVEDSLRQKLHETHFEKSVLEQAVAMHERADNSVAGVFDENAKAELRRLKELERAEESRRNGSFFDTTGQQISMTAGDQFDDDFNTIAELQEKNNQLQLQNRDLLGQIDKLNKACDLLIEERDKAVNSVDPLVQKRLAEYIETVDGRFREMSDQLSSLREDNEKLLALEEDTGRENEALKGENVKIHEKFQVEVEKQAADNADLKAQLQLRILNLQQAFETIAQNNFQIQQLKETEAQLRDEIAELQKGEQFHGLSLASELQNAVGAPPSPLIDQRVTELSRRCDELSQLQRDHDAALRGLDGAISAFEVVADLKVGSNKFDPEQDLSSNLTGFKNRIAFLEKAFKDRGLELRSLQAAASSLRDEIAARDQKIGQLILDKDQAVAEKDGALAQVDALRGEVMDLRGQLEQANARIEELQDVEGRLVEAEAALLGAREEVQRVAQMAQFLQQENDGLKGEKARFEQQLQEAAAREEEYKRITAQQNEQVEDLQARNGELSTASDALQDRLREIEAEMVRLLGVDDEKARLEQEVRQRDSQRQRDDLEKQQLRAQIEEQKRMLAAGLEGKGAELLAAQQQINELRAANVTLARQKLEAENAVEFMRRKNSELEEVIARNEADLSAVRNNVAKLTALTAEQADKIAGLERANNDMRKEAEAVRSALVSVYRSEMRRGEIEGGDAGANDLRDFLELAKAVETKGQEFAELMQQEMAAQVAQVKRQLQAEAARRENDRAALAAEEASIALLRASAASASTTSSVRQRDPKRTSFFGKLNIFKASVKPTDIVDDGAAADADATAAANEEALEAARRRVRQIRDGRGAAVVGGLVADDVAPQPDQFKKLAEEFQQEMAQMAEQLQQQATKLQKNAQADLTAAAVESEVDLNNAEIIAGLGQRLNRLHNRNNELEAMLQYLQNRAIKEGASFVGDSADPQEHLRFLFDILEVLQQEGVEGVLAESNNAQNNARASVGEYGIDFEIKDGGEYFYSVAHKVGNDFFVYSDDDVERNEAIENIENFMKEKIRERLQKRGVVVYEPHHHHHDHHHYAPAPAPEEPVVIVKNAPLQQAVFDKAVLDAAGIVFRAANSAESSSDSEQIKAGKKNRVFTDLKNANEAAVKSGVGLRELVKREFVGGKTARDHNRSVVGSGSLHAILAIGLCLAGKQDVLKEKLSAPVAESDKVKLAEKKVKYRFLYEDFLRPEDRAQALQNQDFRDIVDVAIGAIERLNDVDYNKLFAGLEGRSNPVYGPGVPASVDGGSGAPSSDPMRDGNRSGGVAIGSVDAAAAASTGVPADRRRF